MKKSDDKIYPGQNIAIDPQFRDPDSRENMDPGTVSVMVKRPDNTETLLSTEHLGLGHYRANIVVDQDGDWYWRAESDAPGEAAREGKFYVEKSRFGE